MSWVSKSWVNWILTLFVKFDQNLNESIQNLKNFFIKFSIEYFKCHMAFFQSISRFGRKFPKIEPGETHISLKCIHRAPSSSICGEILFWMVINSLSILIQEKTLNFSFSIHFRSIRRYVIPMRKEGDPLRSPHHFQKWSFVHNSASFCGKA